MCGISFYCSRNKVLSTELLNSLNVSSYRGPDAQGVVEKKVGSFNIGLGHNRLSIVELSDAGAQPMVSDQGVILSYNGEIYNHTLIRDMLRLKGCQFKGDSDTEVILKLYEEYAESAFGMLKGMFSFSILDEKNRKFFIVRDVVGIKPVYIYQKKDFFFACSEIKGLKEFSDITFEIDQGDVYEFFNNGFLYEPSTGFKDIKKLLPGHYLEMNLESSSVSVVCYKALASFLNEKSIDVQVQRAVKSQMFSDVPLGVFFSGGADSSILAKYSENDELFFAKYESDPSADVDWKYSNLIAAHLDKKLIVAELASSNDVDELMESVDFVAKNSEELISDYTFWATYKLSKSARDHGYKVMLSGMGGDEIFAGYPRYHVLKNHNIIKFLSPLLKVMLFFRLFPKKFNKKFERLVSYSSEKNWGVAYSRLLGYFSRVELESLFDKTLDKEFSERIEKIALEFSGDNSDKVKLAQHMDLKGFLAHNLMVSDKASMLASMELRVPFLDESLVAHGLNLESKELLCKNFTKYPLRKLLTKIFPKSLYDRPKTGFNPPLDGMIIKIGKERLRFEFSPLKAYLKFEAVEAILDDHFSATANNTYKLWQLLYFSRWLKYNGDLSAS